MTDADHEQRQEQVCRDAESDYGQYCARSGGRGQEGKGLMGYGNWILH